MTLPEICQRIMTQYAMENNRNNLLVDRKKGNQKNYDHYPILLCQFMQEAFLIYLEENGELYSFLKKKPVVKQMPLEKDYLSDWKTDMYHGIFEHTEVNQLSWYIAVHFIPQKEVNLLIGSIKSYIQYIHDIRRRAAYAGNGIFKDHSEKKIKELQGVLEILDFTLKNCLGRFSGEFSDYYWDISEKKDAKDMYAEELAHYVDYAGAGEPHKYYVLSNFYQELSDEEVRAVYTDGANPVLLRNVELVRLFGMNHILWDVVYQHKVTKRELQTYEAQKRKLKKEFDCQEAVKSEIVQKNICEFQHMKNHIELHDLLKLSELANELNSYLVSLAYMRERDLMYYQIGYYYMKLKYTSLVEKELDSLKGKDCFIRNGAALYQVQAMYTYGMDIYSKKGDRCENKNDLETSKKVIEFHGKYHSYEEGMALFGKESRRDFCVFLRNSIDHAHYYNQFDGKHDYRSILELYSGVYDYFFSYDRKLKMSVPVMLENILYKYNVECVLEFGKRQGNGLTERTDFKIKKKINHRTHTEQTLTSTKYTYKVWKKDRDGNRKKAPQNMLYDVCSRTFLQEVEKLLYYARGKS